MFLIHTLLLLLGSVAVQASGADLPLHHLSLNYSLGNETCKKAADLLSADRLCRAEDNQSNCSSAEWPRFEIGTKTVHAFERIVDNEYGYTTLARSNSAPLEGSTIIHVSDFRGDRNPRLLETWQVSSAQLAEVLAISPGPIPYEQRATLGLPKPKQLLATEFAALLKQGKKVSNEWSPVVEIDGRLYAVVRECSGSWVFGASYECSRVLKVTLLQLSDTAKPRLFCQFSRRIPKP